MRLFPLQSENPQKGIPSGMRIFEGEIPSVMYKLSKLGGESQKFLLFNIPHGGNDSIVSLQKAAFPSVFPLQEKIEI